jgi:hypothetical protein
MRSGQQAQGLGLGLGQELPQGFNKTEGTAGLQTSCLAPPHLLVTLFW